MKNIKIILMILIITGLVRSQSKVGTTAAPFLGIDISPRTSALGGSFVAVANDAFTLYSNPGGISRLKNNEFIIAHTPWLVDTDLNWAGLVISIDDENAVGLNFTYLDYGQEEITTIENPEGTQQYWDAADLAIGVSYARNLTDRFSIGGTIKYIQQRIWHTSASAIALDVGILFRTYFNDMKIGMSISNFGTEMQMTGKDLYRKIDLAPGDGGNNPAITTILKTDSWTLPLLFKVGVAMDVLKISNYTLTTSFDALYPNDNSQYLNAGIEFNWNDNVFLRSGFKSLFRPDANQGFAYGIGLKYNLFGNTTLKIDFSSEEFGVFKDIQRFSLGFTF
ncbi:MAG: hypothetical protein IGBAC_1834 [Ignavibacteriae bacterium]|nr:MAG: hypothetical protein IGBAC_1834 [Ignavibacteriota bacterium]